MDISQRLRRCLPAWKRIGAGETIIDWITKGVPLTFKSTPNKTFSPNPVFSRQHKQFIAQEIQHLLGIGAIEVCRNKPHIVSSLKVVPKKNGKFRLIVNLRPLNEHILLKTYRNEDIRTTMTLLDYGDNLVTIDLQDFFYHVPVREAHSDYLGFKFGNIYYRWRVLPFGLNRSPFYSSKVLRPVVRYIRSTLGIKSQVYVDDFIISATPARITDSLDGVLQTLQDVGYIVNMEKSSLTPETMKVYIGFVVDTMGESGHPEIWVSPPHVRKLRAGIKRLRTGVVCSARQLARVLGQCVSMSPAVAFGKVMLRQCYSLLKTRLN
jgi:hypothetical protein